MRTNSYYYVLGRDFEKVARHDTIFNYSPFNGGRETHEKFWKEREFEVMLLPLANKSDVYCWMKGKVASWYEYNMGPGDRSVKWRLTADIIPTNEHLGVGSCVYHPEKVDQLAVIIEVAEDGDRCTIQYEKDGIRSSGWKIDELKSYDGQLDFEVHRMNAQGGGILKADRLNQIVNNRIGLSMRWLSAVSEIQGDYNPDADHSEKEGTLVPGVAHGLRQLPIDGRLDDRNTGGVWYFDPNQQDLDPSSLVLEELTIKLRSSNINMITNMIGEGGSWEEMKLKLQKLLIGLTGGYDTELCYALLSVPFYLYEELVDFFLQVFSGEADLDDETIETLEETDLHPDEWLAIFHSVVAMGIYLRNDKEWHESNTLNDEDVNAKYDAALYRIINKVGEWYEEQKEFRAAIWCYNVNLKSAKDTNVQFPTRSRKESLISQLCYIGLANKSMDNFVEAGKYYEDAIVECSTANSSAFSAPEVKNDLMKMISGNAKKLQEEAKQWFGSTGRITSWELVSLDDNDNTHKKCQTCGADAAPKKCSACHLVSYCNVECQSSHWKSGHKQVCLGKLRGK